MINRARRGQRTNKSGDRWGGGTAGEWGRGGRVERGGKGKGKRGARGWDCGGQRTGGADRPRRQPCPRERAQRSTPRVEGRRDAEGFVAQPGRSVAFGPAIREQWRRRLHPVEHLGGGRGGLAGQGRGRRYCVCGGAGSGERAGGRRGGSKVRGLEADRRVCACGQGRARQQRRTTQRPRAQARRLAMGEEAGGPRRHAGQTASDGGWRKRGKRRRQQGRGFRVRPSRRERQCIPGR